MGTGSRCGTCESSEEKNKISSHSSDRLLNQTRGFCFQNDYPKIIEHTAHAARSVCVQCVFSPASSHLLSVIDSGCFMHLDQQKELQN